MPIVLKAGVLSVSVEDEAEGETFAQWREAMTGHVFAFESGSEKGGSFHDLGRRQDACREPINIVFDSKDDRWRPIGNLALTPFSLRGRAYASVEGFWQGLKFPEAAERARVAALWGKPARTAGLRQGQPDRFDLDGVTYMAGGAAHRALMLEACQAKFAQNLEARQALVATGERPLTHRVRRDSKTIPGVVLAEFWMRIRQGLR